MTSPPSDTGLRRDVVIAVILGTVLVVTLAIFAAWRLLTPAGDRFAECRQTRIAGAAEIGGPFELVSETGERVTSEELIDGPTLIYFGYTSCPDICPVDAVRNADAADILAERGIDLTPVFITVDPARDTPKVLADFTDALHPDMIGLTGSDDEIEAAVRAFRGYRRLGDVEDTFYLVDHTAFSYLMLPGTGFVEIFGREVQPGEMADRIACFAARA